MNERVSLYRCTVGKIKDFIKLHGSKTMLLGLASTTSNPKPLAKIVESYRYSPLDYKLKLEEREYRNLLLKTVASNPHTPLPVLGKLIKIGSHDVTMIGICQAVGKNPTVVKLVEVARGSKSPKELTDFADNPVWYVRRAVAGNPNSPQDILKKLSEDEVGDVKQAVAGNPNTPPDVLGKLAEEEYEEAAMNPNTPWKSVAIFLSKLSKVLYGECIGFTGLYPDMYGAGPARDPIFEYNEKSATFANFILNIHKSPYSLLGNKEKILETLKNKNPKLYQLIIMSLNNPKQEIISTFDFGPLGYKILIKINDYPEKYEYWQHIDAATTEIILKIEKKVLDLLLSEGVIKTTKIKHGRSEYDPKYGILKYDGFISEIDLTHAKKLLPESDKEGTFDNIVYSFLIKEKYGSSDYISEEEAKKNIIDKIKYKHLAPYLINILNKRMQNT